MPVKVTGIDTILKNLRSIPEIEAKKANDNLRVAGGIVEAAVLEHASLTDYTLEELEAMGHPFSRRFSVDSGPAPDNVVRIQSGLLFDNIEKNEEYTQSVSRVEIGVSPEKVPYIDDLIHGNRLMRKRNFLGGAWDETEELAKGIMRGGR